MVVQMDHVEAEAVLVANPECPYLNQILHSDLYICMNDLCKVYTPLVQIALI